MKSAIVVLAVCLMPAMVVSGQNKVAIYCTSETAPNGSVTVYTAPGSAWIVENLPCGQQISLIGIESTYARIQFGQKTGYFRSWFVRSQKTPAEPERRVEASGSEVKRFEEQQPAVEPVPKVTQPSIAGAPPAPRPPSPRLEGEAKDTILFRALAYRAIPHEQTTHFTTQGHSSTNCYGSGTDWGYSTSINMNCETVTTPPQDVPVTIRSVEVYNALESNGMIYTVTCTAHWIGRLCS